MESSYIYRDEILGSITYKCEVQRLVHAGYQLILGFKGRPRAQRIRWAAIRVVGIVEGLVHQQFLGVCVVRNDEGRGGGDGLALAIRGTIQVLNNGLDGDLSHRPIGVYRVFDGARADQVARLIGADVGGLFIPRVFAGGRESAM